MTTYRYLSATEWGFRGQPATEQLPDAEVYVHHVGGQAWMGGTVAQGEAASHAACVQLLRNLDTYAINVKGYSGGLDYDALGWWDRYNDIAWIAEGRGPYRSAATLDRNEQGEAFCLCGNYSLRAPDPAELELCALGIAYMAQQRWTTDTATILGHRDNPAHPGATGCPGDYLYPHLPAIRQRVAELLTPPPEPPEATDMQYLYRPYGAANVFLVTDGVPEVLDPERFEFVRPLVPKYFDGARTRVNGKPVNKPHQPTIDWLKHTTGVTTLDPHPTEQIAK